MRLDIMRLIFYISKYAKKPVPYYDKRDEQKTLKSLRPHMGRPNHRLTGSCASSMEDTMYL